jgi:hypothetical protein
MNPILALAARLGCLALAVADRLKPRDDAAFDAHIADALAVAAPEPVLPAAMWDACTCPDLLWTTAELIELAPDLAVLDAVTTYDDFVYLTGGDQ